MLKLLIVDDQKTVVDGLLNLIDWNSIGIGLALGAYSAAEARQILTEQKIDVMLCDIEMPVENGLSLVRWMRDQDMQTKCIFLTAHAEFSYAQKSVGLGAFDYVVQPAPYTEIKGAVERAVASLRSDLGKAWQILLSNREGDALAHTGSVQAADSELTDITAATDARHEPGAIRSIGSNLYKNMDRAWNKLRGEGIPEKECTTRLYERLLGTIQKVTGDTDVFWRETLVDTKSYDLYRNASKSRDDLMALVRLVEQRFAQKEQKQEQDVVAAVIHYINENLDQEIHRQDLAEHVYLNPDYLNRLFKKQTGKTLKEFVIEHKMDEARKMLQVTRLPVSIIAAKVGYDNFSHFSYAYKKVTGQSPLESRNAYQRGAGGGGAGHE